MKITIQGVARFAWSPTAEHLAVLYKLSGRHYDAACKHASQVGGFLQGWSNQVDFHEEGDDPVQCWGEFRAFDTCLKIMENPRPLTDAEMELVHDMRRSFNAALSRGNYLYDLWQDEVS